MSYECKTAARGGRAVGVGAPSVVCPLGWRQVHRLTGDIDKPDHAPRIGQGNRPHEAIRGSVIGQKWRPTRLIRPALDVGARPDVIGVKPVRGNGTSGEIVLSPLERGKPHVGPVPQELKETGEMIADRDRHEPRMRPTVRRPYRNRCVYARGSPEPRAADGFLPQHPLCLGVDSIRVVVVRHDYTCLSTAVNAYLNVCVAKFSHFVMTPPASG